MNQWRWSLTETGLMSQHTGTQRELRDAMNDVANTVEYILDNELKEEYQKLVEEYKWNDLVYKSKFIFEPVIGDTYHLYDDGKGDIFLSLITPLEWNRTHIGSFTLNSERKWIKI